MQLGIDRLFCTRGIEVESPMEVIAGMTIDCDFQILVLHSRIVLQ
jgi:hypothetical protein